MRNCICLTCWLLSGSLCSSAFAATLYVTTGGNDANNGLTWPAAKRTVTGALAGASAGDQIHVAMGTYPESITLKAGVALYGGYAGVGDQRDYRNNPTVLDGRGTNVVVSCSGAGVGADTRLDGFVVQHGCNGIYLTACAPTIANNEIQNNTSTGEGAGICCVNGANAIIIGNIIHDNTAEDTYGDGAGICCIMDHGHNPMGTPSNPQILGNTIYYNVANQDGGGVCSKHGSCPLIAGNTITMNIAGLVPSCDTPYGMRTSYGAGGIGCVDGGTATIRDNLVTANAGLHGGGILIFGDNDYTNRTVPILNNTIVGNSPNGVRWAKPNVLPIIVNNIIQGNGVGVSRMTQAGSTGGTPVLSHNCISGNAMAFDGWADPGWANGNLPTDARLAGAGCNNFHLQPASPCRNAGDLTYLVPNETDAYGKPRTRGGQVDIGADECDGTLWNVAPAVIRVSITGNDGNNGSTWPLAKRHVATALAAAEAAGGAQVWVAQGTYAESGLLLRPFVYLYGGFAGNEASLGGRNVAAHPTTLDGANTDNYVLRAVGAYQLSAMDGFTITRSRVLETRGGGLSSFLSGAIIQSNTIAYNNAPLGAGLALYGSTSLIQNNLIVSNTAAFDGQGVGAGIYGEWSTPCIQNNNIAHNTASDGGGLYLTYSKPAIINNCIHDNTGNGINGQNAYYCEWMNLDSTLIANNLIYRNQVTSAGGGGMSLLYCAGVVANNLIAYNWTSGVQGGGLFVTHGADFDGLLIAVNNTLVGNSCNLYGMISEGAGIFSYLVQNPTLVLENNIIAYNQSGLFNLSAYPSPVVSPALTNNDVYGNIFLGNNCNYQTNYITSGPINHPTDISLEPGFVDAINYDYHLRSGVSPCIGAAATTWLPATDIEGVPRATPDMGAFEHYNTSLTAPAGLAASGAFPDHIHLTWATVPNANSYEVWRRPAATPGAQSNLVYEAMGQTNNAFDDFAVSSSPTNTYFLKAKLTVNRVVIITTGGEMNYAFQPVVYDSPPSTPVNGSVTPVPPYQQWRQSQFTPLQITNSSISGDLADPDHDGLPNIWKYAMGLNPWMAPGPGLVRADLFHTNSAVYATMTYRLAKPAPADLTLFVDCTTNLASLNWTTNGVTTLGTVDWGTYLETTVRAPWAVSERKQGFLRLRLNEPSP